MKSYIEILEQIGQSHSLQQYDNVKQMLDQNDLSGSDLTALNDKSEHVCVLFVPEK